MRRTLLAAGAVVAAGLGGSASQGAAGQTVAIVGATVFDGTGAAPHKATVVLQGERILEVGPKVRVPAGARVIRADGQALLPGFFDVHTHWTPNGAPAFTPQIASAYVRAGVTTVNDFNAAPESFEPRRAWVAELASPHVRYVARISTPGGHGADWADQATTRWVNTPEGARAAVRSLFPYKPDSIKAFSDGWRYGTAPDNTSMDGDTLAALVDEAHKSGWKVLTHTVTEERGRVAARAKVDVIGHSLQDREIDQATVDMIKKAGTAYAATLAVYEPTKSGEARDMNDPKVQQSFRKFEHALHNLKRLSDAGVLVALGTDAGMEHTPHGVSTLREMELMVRAGLTPTQALMAGTANSARALDLLSDRGTIEKGKRADLVLVKGTPWVDIADVRKTERVFVDGRQVFGPDAQLPAANAAVAPAATPAQALIDDFERADGRSSLDTLRTEDPDGGLDRTVEIAQRIAREGGGHALSLSARMAAKARPEAGVIIPLSRGSIRPVDARAFKGVRFDVRGDGAYDLVLKGVASRWAAPFTGQPEWRTVEVPFAALKGRPWRGEAQPFTGADLVEVEFSGSRGAGERMWLEIDNVRFY